jgi:hypothetical protein
MKTKRIYLIVLLAMVFCITAEAHSLEWDKRSKKPMTLLDARLEVESLKLAGWRLPTNVEARSYPDCGNKPFQAWGINEDGKTNNVNHLNTYEALHYCGSTGNDIVWDPPERPEFYLLLVRD